MKDRSLLNIVLLLILSVTFLAVFAYGTFSLLIKANIDESISILIAILTTLVLMYIAKKEDL